MEDSSFPVHCGEQVTWKATLTKKKNLCLDLFYHCLILSFKCIAPFYVTVILFTPICTLNSSLKSACEFGFPCCGEWVAVRCIHPPVSSVPRCSLAGAVVSGCDQCAFWKQSCSSLKSSINSILKVFMNTQAIKGCCTYLRITFRRV